MKEKGANNCEGISFVEFFSGDVLGSVCKSLSFTAKGESIN